MPKTKSRSNTRRRGFYQRELGPTGRWRNVYYPYTAQDRSNLPASRKRLRTVRRKPNDLEEVEERVPLGKDKFLEMILDLPKGKDELRKHVIVLTHGAGGDMKSAQLETIAKHLSEGGFSVARFTCKPPNFNYRLKCFNAVLEYLKNHPEHKFTSCLIGGRSMGARVAAQVASDEQDSFIKGVICLSYPLHKPNQFKDLRDSHLLDISSPILFIQGSNDEMCRMDLMKTVVDKLKTTVRVHWIDGASHSLTLPKGKESDSSDVNSFPLIVLGWCKEILSS